MDDYEAKQQSKKSKHRVRVSITNVDFEPDKALEEEEEYYDDSDDNILEKLRQKSINEAKRRLDVAENNKDGHARGVSWGTVTRIELDYSLDPETAENTVANRPKLDKTAVSHPVTLLQKHYSSSPPTLSPSPMIKKKGRKVRMHLKPIASEGNYRHKNNKYRKNKSNKNKDKDFLGGIGRVLLFIFVSITNN